MNETAARERLTALRRLPGGLLLVALIISVCALYFSAPAAAGGARGGKRPASVSQNVDRSKPVVEMVRSSKAAGASFVRRELFRSAVGAADADPGIREALRAGVVFDLNKAASERVLRESAASLTLPLPDGKGGTVELELVRVNIFAPSFSVVTSKLTTESYAKNLGIHYRGIVKGDENSLAAVSVFNDEVMGFFSTEMEGNSVLGKLDGDNPTDRHVLYAERDLSAGSDFSCDTEDAGGAMTPPAAASLDPEELLARCVRIYIEADHDLFLNKGNVGNTTNYMTGVFNQAAALYANEGLSVTISQIFVWNSPSPYTGTNSRQQLEQFKAFRPSFNGDLAHLVSLQSSFGGIAYVPGLCNGGAAYAFSGINPTFSNVPTYSWTVEVFTHETGHNLGSQHTHACVWNGDNTAIDGCAVPTGSCPRPGLPAVGGTVMSYCHQTNVGINFSQGFGPQPRNVILNRFNAVTCLSDCGGGNTVANNNFASAQALSGNSGTVNGANSGATKEAGEPNHGGNSGGASVWYTWQAPSSGAATFSTAGSSFDTLLGVYTGGAVGSLTLVGENDDVGGGDLTSRVQFNATAGTTYRIAVDGYGGATGSVTLNWNNVPPPPSNNNFASAQVISGSAGAVNGANSGATKEAGEPNHGGNSGGASVWYIWQAPASGAVTMTTLGSNYDTLLGVYTGSAVGSLNLVGGNDDDLTLNSLTSRVLFNATAGTTYRIAVDGYTGMTGNLTLNWVTDTIGPPNNNFASAQALSGNSGTVTSTNSGATKEAGEPNHGGNSGGASVWYTWQAPASGAATLTTAGSNYDTLLGVYTGGAVGSLTLVGGNDDVGGGDLTSRVQFNATAGTTYRIAVDGYGGIIGGFQLNWSLASSSTVQLSGSAFSVNESERRVSINVMRVGSDSSSSSVSYATSDGTAIDGRDYLAALGTLTFAPGETQKTVTVFILNDVYGEGPETFQFTVSNAVGDALGSPASATITIQSDEAQNGLNPMRTTTNGVPSFNADFFVRQQYLDFFNREGDQPGIDFWRNQITACGADQACIDLQKERVSSEFFRSIEFQTTGYFVYRAYAAALGPQRIGGTVPLTLREFLPATQQIGRGVVVGQPGWEAQIEANRAAFVSDFVNRNPFLAAYPLTQTPQQFVDAMNANTGGSLSPAERNAAVNEFGGAVNIGDQGARARALRRVVEDVDFAARERNRAFVLMQYFGYLRRNPPDAPELTLDYQGYNFWLGKLNQFGGDAVAAQMVKAFIVSEEYKLRFGP